MGCLHKRILIIITAAVMAQSCVSAGSLKKGAHPSDRDASWLIWFYRVPLNHLSAVRQGQCPMYPSDSTYSLQAIRKHGPLVGWMMAFDRLMRCGRDETRLAPQVLVNGRWKYYDPVEVNDFWWSDKKQTTK